MSVRVISHTFASLEGEWERLLPRATVNTLFLTPHWQRLWWEAFGEGARLLLLAFQDEPGLAGIAPMMLRDRALSFLGDTDLFDYHDFIVPQGQESAFYPRLVEYLASEEWEELCLSSLPESSPTLVHLPDLARSRGWSCQVEREGVAPGLSLPQDWDSYLGGLTKKDRHELRRKHRRLEGASNARSYVGSNPEAVGGCLDDFFHLMGESRGDKRAFLTSQRQGFFRSVVEDLAARRMLQLYFMDLGSDRVASTLCFDYQGQRLLYNSGFNPAHASLSVGLLLNAYTLKDAIHHGMRYFDFLRGDEAYKYHLGGKDRLLYRMVVKR
jgi:CelD/BcsL family acetyltransferase involved in cellulose biosynthesis